MDYDKFVDNVPPLLQSLNCDFPKQGAGFPEGSSESQKHILRQTHLGMPPNVWPLNMGEAD